MNITMLYNALIAAGCAIIAALSNLIVTRIKSKDLRERLDQLTEKFHLATNTEPDPPPKTKLELKLEKLLSAVAVVREQIEAERKAKIEADLEKHSKEMKDNAERKGPEARSDGQYARPYTPTAPSASSDVWSGRADRGSEEI